MSETKQAFSIDKPGAYKTRDGQVVDIVEVTVTGRSAFGWFRTDTAPCPLRRWDTSGRGYIPIPHDIIEAIPFVVDGPGRYMMRDGRVAMVDQMNRQDGVSGQRIGGWYKSNADGQKTDTSWHVNGAWHTMKGTDNDRDLVRKMHPLEQEPGAKASKEQKAPETPKTQPTLHDVMQSIDSQPTQKATEEQLTKAYKEPWRAAQLNKKPTFWIDEIGTYATQDGHSVAIVSENRSGEEFYGQMLVDGKRRSDRWDVNGVFLNEDTCNKNGSKNIVRKCTSNDIIENGRVRPLSAGKKPTVAITQTGQYRTRDGRLANIAHIGRDIAIGYIENVRGLSNWWNDGRYNEHCESNEDIVEKIEQHVETKTLDPVAKWSEEAMRHIEEYVAIIKKEGGPMDPSIEDALRVLRPDLCPPKAGQEKTGAEVMEALGKAATRVADEPKKPSAGFDLVIIRLNEQKCMLVVGDYENDDGDVKVRPIDDLDPVYVQRKCPDAIILKGDSYVMCPDTSISCVVHYGGEDASENVESKQLTISQVDAALIANALEEFDSLTTKNKINLPYELDFSFRESLKILKR